MKTKTTITVEKWQYTAVRLRDRRVKTTCHVCEDKATAHSAKAPPCGSKGKVIETGEPRAADITEYRWLRPFTDKKNNGNEND
jgi:hypothetical protein